MTFVYATYFTQAIAADPLLFDPDRALTDAALPQGKYRCRTFKLGGRGTATRDFTAYPWFDCQVADEGEVRSLHKVTGSQRPTGLIFADTVFPDGFPHWVEQFSSRVQNRIPGR